MAETLDIIQLRTFVAIADCGGFGRAASALHLAQPTVSQHVRLLEKRLGQVLVEKSGRLARFTRAGDRLLVEARRIIAVHDDALERLDVASDDEVIIIGSTETAADQVLPRLLSTVRDAYPDRVVRFHIDRSTQMEEAVAKGTIDLAILLSVGPDVPGIEITNLPLNWYSAPTWSPPSATAPIPLVAYVEPCGMRTRAMEQLRAAGQEVDVVAESTSLEGVIAAARAGLGVAVLPSTGAEPIGLVERTDLPDLGTISLRLATRRGLDPEIQESALEALKGFFADESAVAV